ncbi:MAG TPA: hypothetical protein VIC32_06040, partial [Terriglobales bacterium]
MDYLLAIDGGGTKTDVAVATLNGSTVGSIVGSIVARVRVGGTSLSHHSHSAVAETLAAAVRQLPVSQAATESSMGGDRGGGPRTGVPSAASGRWGGRNSEGRPAVVKRIPPGLRSAVAEDGGSDAAS